MLLNGVGSTGVFHNPERTKVRKVRRICYSMIPASSQFFISCSASRFAVSAVYFVVFRKEIGKGVGIEICSFHMLPKAGCRMVQADDMLKSTFPVRCA